MGDVASGARWTCSWGAPMVISRLSPPPQSQGPPGGRVTRRRGTDVRDSLSVGIWKWTRRRPAGARRGKAGRCGGRTRAPSAWAVRKRSQEGKRLFCTLYRNFFFKLINKELGGRRESGPRLSRHRLWVKRGLRRAPPAARGAQGAEVGTGPYSAQPRAREGWGMKRAAARRPPLSG